MQVLLPPGDCRSGDLCDLGSREQGLMSATVAFLTPVRTPEGNSQHSIPTCAVSSLSDVEVFSGLDTGVSTFHL